MTTEEEARVLDSCRLVEAKIETIEKAVLESRPNLLDQCEADLREVAAILQSLISSGNKQMPREARESLDRIRRTSIRMQRQVEHGSNLWIGWLQLRLNAGYTNRGRPVFTMTESATSFEG